MEPIKVQFSIQEIETKFSNLKTFNMEGHLTPYADDPSYFLLAIKANKRIEFTRKRFNLKEGCIVTINNKSFSVQNLISNSTAICLILKEIETRKIDVLQLAAKQFINSI